MGLPGVKPLTYKDYFIPLLLGDFGPTLLYSNHPWRSSKSCEAHPCLLSLRVASLSTPTPIYLAPVQVAQNMFITRFPSTKKYVARLMKTHWFPLRRPAPPPQKKTPHLSASSGTLGLFFGGGTRLLGCYRPAFRPLTFNTENRGTKAGPAPVRCAFALKTLAPPAKRDHPSIERETSRDGSYTPENEHVPKKGTILVGNASSNH